MTLYIVAQQASVPSALVFENEVFQISHALILFRIHNDFLVEVKMILRSSGRLSLMSGEHLTGFATA